MSKTLADWHTDHANFARLLTLLEGQLSLFHDGDAPDYEMMVDVMYYLTHYADTVHHPKEDLVFAVIRGRDGRAARRIDELISQHVSLKRYGNELLRDLDNIVSGTIMSRERVLSTARIYIANLRGHMQIEESEILPLAARLLGEGDWAKIDEAISQIEDPLFGTHVEERYGALRRQIARDAQAARAPKPQVP
jgi:hemerythrin-like domain-containing protein